MGGPPDAGGAKNAIQARASTVSYLERYTLKAILGISEQEDDNDGGSGEFGDQHPQMKGAKSMQELVKVMNGLDQASKKKYVAYFNVRMQEFKDAAGE